MADAVTLGITVRTASADAVSLSRTFDAHGWLGAFCHAGCALVTSHDTSLVLSFMYITNLVSVSMILTNSAVHSLSDAVYR
jgi:hypothetical protein